MDETISVSPVAQEDEEGWRIVTSKSRKVRSASARSIISPSTGSIMRSVVRHSPASVTQSSHSRKTERPVTLKGLPIPLTITIKTSSTESWRVQKNKGKANVTSECSLKQTHALRMPRFESASSSKRQYSGSRSDNSSSSSTASAVRRSLPSSISRQSKYKETESSSADIKQSDQFPLDEHMAEEIPNIPTVTAANNIEPQVERPQPQAVGFQEPMPNITQNITQEKIRQMVIESIHLENERSQNKEFQYQTPYPREIEETPFPADFKHPDFQKFNGNGSPEEHIMHFIAKMGNFSRIPQFCLRLFGSSLTGRAFRWYSGLIPGSIHTWEQMQDAFMSNFFSSDREISLTELASIRQEENESVEEFISRWKDLAVSCQHPLQESEQVELCLEGMRPELACHLISKDWRTFRNFATKAYALEKMMGRVSAFQSKSAHITRKEETKEDYQDVERDSDEEDRNGRAVIMTYKRSRQNKDHMKYAFSRKDILPMLNQLLAMKSIELPRLRHLEEIENTRGMDYCHYHRKFGHHTENCNPLRNKLQKMIDRGEIAMKEHDRNRKMKKNDRDSMKKILGASALKDDNMLRMMSRQ